MAGGEAPPGGNARSVVRGAPTRGRSFGRAAGLITVPIFFLLKIGAAVVLLVASTAWLRVAEFAEFTQLGILAALINLAAVGGAQNGLVQLAAIAGDNGAIARAQGAALAIWAVVACALGLTAIWLRSPLSILLVGHEQAADAALSVVLITLAAGPGQIITSILTGRQRPGPSLLAQGLGLIAGSAGALWLLSRGEARGAAVAFAAGSLVTMAASFALHALTRQPRPSFVDLRFETRRLLAFSGSTAAVIVFISVVLFGLRALYRDAFGMEMLGHWLAANRISDTTTQFLSLALIQLFVPRFGAANGRDEEHRLILWAWGIGVVVMGSGLVVFALASEPIVELVLSTSFVPAIPAILLYMAGDVMRVWTALLSYALIARGRPVLFAAIEVGTVALMAGLTLAGIAMNVVLAPMYAYLIAYVSVAAAISSWYALRVSRRAAANRADE